MRVLIILSLLGYLSNLSLPIAHASPSLDDVNQRVCDRFEEDINKMGAIMEELKNRQGILETRVAFGGVDTPIESADYWVNFAAEATSYQRVQKYSSKDQLRSSLEVLKGKIVRAKNEVRKALEYEK